MRNGSAALVPLLLSIMTLFWFIWFLGGESDMLNRVNKIENLQNLQERLLVSAIRYRYNYERNNPNASEDNITATVNIYINDVMKLNGIQE